MSRHLPVNPEGMPPARGFSHGVLSMGGRILHIAGETGHGPDLGIDEDFVAQFGRACRNVAQVVEAAGGEVTDVVSLTIFVTDISEYRNRLSEVGPAYRSVFGRHFPAMSLIGISELVDQRARVEIQGVAVIPD